jgi:HEAT repeat protein
VSRRVAWALGCALALSGCASHDKLEQDDRSVSEEEVAAAGESEAAELTPHLHHILAHRGDYTPEVVVAALVSLGERKDPASVAPVAGLAQDEDEEVRWHVARTLRALGGAEAEATLARMAREDPSELVREAAGAP